MANQGWPDDAGAGVQTSSTTNQGGKGTVVDDAAGFIHGSQVASPGGPENDPLDAPGDVFEPAGQLACTPEI